MTRSWIWWPKVGLGAAVGFSDPMAGIHFMADPRAGLDPGVGFKSWTQGSKGWRWSKAWTQRSQVGLGGSGVKLRPRVGFSDPTLDLMVQGLNLGQELGLVIQRWTWSRGWVQSRGWAGIFRNFSRIREILVSLEWNFPFPKNPKLGNFDVFGMKLFLSSKTWNWEILVNLDFNDSFPKNPEVGNFDGFGINQFLLSQKIWKWEINPELGIFGAFGIKLFLPQKPGNFDAFGINKFLFSQKPQFRKFWHLWNLIIPLPKTQNWEILVL